MNPENYQTPDPGKIIQLFWKAAGADQFILKRSTYSDHIKYACLGGIVVATGVMAAIAGGYAFYTIFSPKGEMSDLITHWPTAILSVIFGTLWGLMIFNIDRFIVTSTGKGDGTEAITKQELIGALPRIIMGMILALTISKPVEIRMFQSEIEAELYSKKQEQLNIYRQKIESNFIPSINAIQKDIDDYQKKIDLTYLSYQDKYNQWDECTKTRSGNCPHHKAESELAFRVWEDTKRNIAPIIQSKLKEKEKWQSLMDKGLGNAEEQSKGLDGLLERIKISHEIAGFWISTFITLLFMAIELTPIFFKLMLIKSPYDYMEENIKELIKAENAIQVQYNYYQDKQGIERHLVTYHNARKIIDEKIKLIETQQKLSDEVINNWEQQQQAKIKDDVNSFIREEPPHKA